MVYDKRKVGQLMKNASAAIIGGADGPTAIFVASRSMTLLLLFAAAAVLLVAGAVVFAVYRHSKNKKG